jgi:hypothetical protein
LDHCSLQPNTTIYRLTCRNSWILCSKLYWFLIITTLALSIISSIQVDYICILYPCCFIAFFYVEYITLFITSSIQVLHDIIYIVYYFFCPRLARNVLYCLLLLLYKSYAEYLILSITSSAQVTYIRLAKLCMIRAIWLTRWMSLIQMNPLTSLPNT